VGDKDLVSRFRNWFTWFVLVLAIFIATIVVVPSVLGFDRYVIEGGSMEPNIPKGSVVYSKPAKVAELKVGDIITYEPPPDSNVDELVTHRIVSKTPRIDAAGNRKVVFRTQGDANPDPDPWRFTLTNDEAALEQAHIPYLGYVYAALAIPWVRFVLITVPALSIILFTILSLWRETGREVEEEKKRRALASPQQSENADPAQPA
jgi:signal peptidase I